MYIYAYILIYIYMYPQEEEGSQKSIWHQFSIKTEICVGVHRRSETYCVGLWFQVFVPTCSEDS